MSKTLEKIAKLPYVMHVDDERGIGNSIIIMLKDHWYYQNDPDCGTMGFDTVQEAYIGTQKKAVIHRPK